MFDSTCRQAVFPLLASYPFNGYFSLLIVLGLANAHTVILALRTYALYGRAKYMFVILIVMFSGSVVVNIVGNCMPSFD